MKTVLICFAALSLTLLAAAPRDRSPDNLLGKSVEMVLAKHGAPDDYSVGTGFFLFTYKGKNGETGRFAFSDGVAFATPPATFRPKHVRPLPDNGLYPGQPIGAAVRFLGQPDEYSCGMDTVTAHYGDGSRALICDGRVFHEQ